LVPQISRPTAICGQESRLRQKVSGYGLRPRRSFFSDNLASINARIVSRWLCTSSRKASTVDEDGAGRRQFNRNSMGADTGCNRQN
jgi:S-adenosylmethionine:diacylglycerol 3-amino-3-carboxypropyl transferase